MAMEEALLVPSGSNLAREFRQELLAIADWWLQYSQDAEQGGFYGEVGLDNRPRPDADKGVVLNARILWFFSTLAQRVDDPRYRRAAQRSYRYFLKHFVDPEHGGVFWMLDAKGQPKDTKKQVYAQAFAIYALVAYYRFSGEALALEEARKAFVLLENHTRDLEHGGYLEAFSRNWGRLDDVRLSVKDLNSPKSMNTHLHVLEAYTTLYQVDPTERVKTALRYAIDCFDQHIIDKSNYHLRMFMGHDWSDHSTSHTFGHDIETSWLLAKAAESLNDPEVSQRLRSTILDIAHMCLEETLGDRGEMYEGYDFASGEINHDRVWWVQAEAMVGFVKAYQLCGDERFMEATQALWAFIKEYQMAPGGEWSWLSSLDNPCRADAYKLGPWKGPYHNGRAMLELESALAFTDQQ